MYPCPSWARLVSMCCCQTFHHYTQASCYLKLVLPVFAMLNEINSTLALGCNSSFEKIGLYSLFLNSVLVKKHFLSVKQCSSKNPFLCQTVQICAPYNYILLVLVFIYTLWIHIFMLQLYCDVNKNIEMVTCKHPYL